MLLGEALRWGAAPPGPPNTVPLEGSFLIDAELHSLLRPGCIVSPKGCFLAVPSSLSGPPSPPPAFVPLSLAGTVIGTDARRLEELISTITGRGISLVFPPPFEIPIASPILPSSLSRGGVHVAILSIRQWTALELMG